MNSKPDSELTVTERLARIQENHDKCVAKLSPAMVECLPELHRDRSWLLELVKMYRSEHGEL